MIELTRAMHSGVRQSKSIALTRSPDLVCRSHRLEHLSERENQHNYRTWPRPHLLLTLKSTLCLEWRSARPRKWHRRRSSSNRQDLQFTWLLCSTISMCSFSSMPTITCLRRENKSRRQSRHAIPIFPSHARIKTIEERFQKPSLSLINARSRIIRPSL